MLPRRCLDAVSKICHSILELEHFHPNSHLGRYRATSPSIHPISSPTSHRRRRQSAKTSILQKDIQCLHFYLTRQKKFARMEWKKGKVLKHISKQVRESLAILPSLSLILPFISLVLHVTMCEHISPDHEEPPPVRNGSEKKHADEAGGRGGGGEEVVITLKFHSYYVRALVASRQGGRGGVGRWAAVDRKNEGRVSSFDIDGS